MSYLSFRRREFFGLAAGAIALRAQDPEPKKDDKKEFEVASIKPGDPNERGMRIQIAPGGRFIATNITARVLIMQAYQVQPFQILNAPAWASTAPWVISAKGEGEGKPDTIRPMLQELLTTRFQLTFHRETKEMPTYALVVAKGGPKLKESAPEAQGPRMRMGRGQLETTKVKMSGLANQLAQQLGRSVIDRTELTGDYDFKLEWTPDPGEGMGIKGPGEPPPAFDSNGPTIYTALQEQLGLKLESTKGPVELLVIDQLEKPTEN